MCGIWGVADFAGLKLDTEATRRASSMLAHRGPDGEGVYRDHYVALVHRRLAILDLSDRSNQPLETRDGRFVLAFNGEIFNFRDLARQLGLSSEEAASDTLVVLRCLEEWGLDTLKRLNGMYAISIWDREAKRLVLVRDQFGIKPLYYSYARGRVVFSSELVVLAGQIEGSSLSSQALAEFMYFGNPLGDKTFYSNISHVPVGTALQFDAVGIRADLLFGSDVDGRRSSSAPAVFRGELEKSVGRHLTSDRPLAILLSGGLDSGSLTALAARASAGPIHTVSVHFDGESSDDSRLAEKTAAWVGTQHHAINVSVSSSRAVLERLASAFGEPFGDAAAIPLYEICLQVKKEFTVVLQGDGGDELMGGYSRYRHLIWMDRIHAFRPGPSRALRGFGSIMPSRGARYARALGASASAERFGRLLTQEGGEMPTFELLHNDIRGDVEGCDPFVEYRLAVDQLADLPTAEQMRLLDLKIVLSNTFLPKVDRATMAASVEARVPFLDREFAGYALSVPIDAYAAGRRSKLVLRQAMAGLLPPDVLAAPKRGFGVPVGRWMKGELGSVLEELLADERNSELLSRSNITRRLRMLQAGRAPFGTDVLLYRCLQLALWRISPYSCR